MRTLAVAAVLLCACSSGGAGNDHQEDAPVGGHGGDQATEGGVGGDLADGGDGAEVAAPGDAQEPPHEGGAEVAEVHADATQESAAPCVSGARRAAVCDPSTMSGAALTSCGDPNEMCRPVGASTTCVCDPNKNVALTCAGSGVCRPGEFCCGDAGGQLPHCCGFDGGGNVYVRQ